MSGLKRSRTDDVTSSPVQSKRTTNSSTSEQPAKSSGTVEDEYDCPICFDLMSEAFVARCGHSFCNKCFQRVVDTLRRCPKCQFALQPSDIFPNYTLNSIIEKYRQQRPLSQIFSKFGSTIDHISDLVTNIHSLNPEDLDRLISVIRKHKEKLDTNSEYVQNRLLEIFLTHVHNERSTTISSLRKELNIVDQDLLQMNKRQKYYGNLFSSHNSSMAQNESENESTKSSSRTDNDDNNNTSRVTQSTTINDTVPNWTQPGRQDLHATPTMKTNHSGETNLSSLNTTNESTTNPATLVQSECLSTRMATAGAVVPEETVGQNLDTNDEIEARTKIMMRFIDDLTNIYFSTRNSLKLSVEDDGSCDDDTGLSVFRESLSSVTKYSRCKPIATVNFVGENSGQASIVSSIEFDRDHENFAVAGVSKKIKLYEYQSILDNTVDIHYPTKEVQCTAKLSCISWNPYLRNYLASSDYDGFVSIWDMATAQKVRTFQEHEKRSWSVDFCSVDPKLLASCSDDCRVKIWSMHNDYSVTTIDAKSNVCCVEFQPDSQYNIVFGTADHNLYYFDLRNTREPCRQLKGHKKAVSYAKFLSNNEIISASTDSQLRLWRVNEGQCVRTYRGHMNEKNFVGLAVSSGFIVCGSETNTVHLYQRDISRPLFSYKFDEHGSGITKSAPLLNPDRVKKDDSGSDFVSAMCWSNRENILLAANSQGVVKVLELV